MHFTKTGRIFSSNLQTNSTLTVAVKESYGALHASLGQNRFSMSFKSTEILNVLIHKYSNRNRFHSSMDLITVIYQLI